MPLYDYIKFFNVRQIRLRKYKLKIDDQMFKKSFETFFNAECRMQNAELLTCRERGFWGVGEFLIGGGFLDFA
jgi:hypothetical protein